MYEFTIMVLPNTGGRIAWILKDDVSVLRQSTTFDTREEARTDVLDFKKDVARASIKQQYDKDGR